MVVPGRFDNSCNPTPEETVFEEVANEDDGVNKASDDVPEGGDEELKVQISYWKAWKGRQFAQNSWSSDVRTIIDMS
ncbi:hypothetical protein TIFTF001_019954 [Ficus carica]|uniref:Uncharacterized protein n=1 Tax=Ficus carica TaxID=3494 RepID=A0AA88A9T6_FICCA|nr:hypothetical protein TIFTF001_019954 [Ficus carica]